MSSLRVENLPQLHSHSYWDTYLQSPTVLVSSKPGGSSFHVTATEVLRLQDGSDRFLAVRATSLDGTVEDSESGCFNTVVLNFYVVQSVWEEIPSTKPFHWFLRAYQELPFLQGTVIPKLYGVYECQPLVTPNWSQLFCMVLEDCGNPLLKATDFDHWSSDIRHNIMEKFAQIQHFHLDFDWRDILVKGNEYRVSSSSLYKFIEHECTFVYDQLSSVIEHPHMDSHCDGIVRTAEQIEVWWPEYPNVDIFPNSGMRYSYKMYPCQKIINELLPKDPSALSNDEQDEILHWLQDIRHYQLEADLDHHNKKHLDAILKFAKLMKPVLAPLDKLLMDMN